MSWGNQTPIPAPVEHQEKTASRFRFGLFEADADSGELRRSGVRIRLQAQPFRVLICLLERNGEVVTREEMQQRLWGTDTIVDFDHSLGTAINKLREALGDSAENPRFIETLARRGYRFLAPVTVADSRLAETTPHVREFAESAQSVEAEAARESAAIAPVHGRAIWVRVVAGVSAAMLLLAGGFVAGLQMRRSSQSPPLISQVTFSGRGSPGAPLDRKSLVS